MSVFLLRIKTSTSIKTHQNAFVFRLHRSLPGLRGNVGSEGTGKDLKRGREAEICSLRNSVTTLPMGQISYPFPRNVRCILD